VTSSGKTSDSARQPFAPAEAETHAGHRERLRNRFDRAGLEGLGDHEILEFLLFYVNTQKDTKPVAKALLSEFGSIEGIFAARPEQLLNIAGIGPQAVRLFLFFREVSTLILKRKSLHGNTTISSISDLLSYLGASMANLPEEEFRVLFFNHANCVLKDEVFSHGTEDQTAVFPRKIMKRALGLHSTGILVVHNHPSGLISPSQADRDITRSLHAAALALEIRLLDHIIIGREGKGYFSFRENRLIP
jgi:DNA repair protein RadC